MSFLTWVLDLQHPFPCRKMVPAHRMCLVEEVPSADELDIPANTVIASVGAKLTKNGLLRIKSLDRPWPCRRDKDTLEARDTSL